MSCDMEMINLRRLSDKKKDKCALKLIFKMHTFLSERGPSLNERIPEAPTLRPHTAPCQPALLVQHIF